jgi:hypothetical protein
LTSGECICDRLKKALLVNAVQPALVSSCENSGRPLRDSAWGRCQRRAVRRTASLSSMFLRHEVRPHLPRVNKLCHVASRDTVGMQGVDQARARAGDKTAGRLGGPGDVVRTCYVSGIDSNVARAREVKENKPDFEAVRRSLPGFLQVSSSSACSKRPLSSCAPPRAQQQQRWRKSTRRLPQRSTCLGEASQWPRALLTQTHPLGLTAPSSSQAWRPSPRTFSG